jgi:hypothetical protein
MRAELRKYSVVLANQEEDDEEDDDEAVCTGEQKCEPEPRLSERLAILGLKIVPMCGDGNCLCYAVGHQMGCVLIHYCISHTTSSYAFKIGRAREIDILGAKMMFRLIGGQIRKACV